MMLKSPGLSATLLTTLVAPAWASVEAPALDEAFDDYFKVIASLNREVAGVPSASALALLLDKWTAANRSLATVLAAFLEENASIKRSLKRLPPETRARFERMEKILVEYPAVQPTVNTLIDRYGGDLLVQSALKKLQQSMAALQNAGQ